MVVNALGYRLALVSDEENDACYQADCHQATCIKGCSQEGFEAATAMPLTEGRPRPVTQEG